MLTMFAQCTIMVLIISYDMKFNYLKELSRKGKNLKAWRRIISKGKKPKTNNPEKEYLWKGITLNNLEKK